MQFALFFSIPYVLAHDMNVESNVLVPGGKKIIKIIIIISPTCSFIEMNSSSAAACHVSHYT